jgi:hypothetical protein
VADSSWRLILPTLAGKAVASNAGGSFLGAVLEADEDRSVEWLMCSYGLLEMLDEKDDSLELALARGTATQSGSSVALNGFDGRWGFNITEESLPPSVTFGGATVDLAIFPLSSHHLC